MTDKRKTISEVLIGEKVDSIFTLESLSTNTRTCVLSDKSGSIQCSFAFEPSEAELVPLTGGAVKAQLIIKPGKDGQKGATIKSIQKADKTEYKTSDLFNGLTEEVKATYRASILKNISFIKNAELRSLVCAIYNDGLLDRLSEYPATVHGLGTYKGGALALTANLLELVRTMGVSYVTLSNKLHADNIWWSLALTAASLSMAVCDRAYTSEEPFAKTAQAIERGYGSLLQSFLDKTIATASIDLSEETYSKLLNCLGCVGEQHSQISPTSKEGILLQQAYSTYARLDSFDLYKTDNIPVDGESGYSYSKSNRMYVDTGIVDKTVENAS